MPEYTLEQNDLADQWEATAAAELQKASELDEISDHYVLLTVVFASVLFFGGIAGKFQSEIIDLAVLIVAGILFLVGLGIILTFPVK